MHRRLRTLIARLASAAVIAVTLGVAAGPAHGYGGYEDVHSFQFYARAVAWMSDAGVTTGTSPGCFSPNDDVTRGQAAAFLFRLEDSPGGSSPHAFVDVPVWLADAVSWMSANGITNGVDAFHFETEKPVTRGDFATFLYRYDGTAFRGGHPFVDISHSYQNAPVAWMYANGITGGVDATHFAPHRTITRAEVATLLWRYVGEPPVAAVEDEACRDAAGGTYVTPDRIGATVGPGVVEPAPTAVVGSRTLSADGAVLANVVVNGCLTVTGDRVTIRNVVVNCPNTYPIRVSGADDLLVDYSRLDCQNNDTKGMFLDSSSDFTIDHVEITRCDDQLFIERGLGESYVTNSVFHNQPPDTDAHSDGIQLGSFDHTDGTLVIDGNWWEYNRTGCCENAVLFLSSAAAVVAEVRDNYLDGDFGTHLLRCHSSSQCIIENNTIAYEPDGFVVHDTSSRTGIARCNRYVGGALVPGRMFNGIPVDNSNC